MSYPILTPVQTVELLIRNDERNVRDVLANPALGDKQAVVIADCAARLFQARQVDAMLGQRELERKAEANLRKALKGWRDR